MKYMDLKHIKIQNRHDKETGRCEVCEGWTSQGRRLDFWLELGGALVPFPEVGNTDRADLMEKEELSFGIWWV